MSLSVGFNDVHRGIWNIYAEEGLTSFSCAVGVLKRNTIAVALQIITKSIWSHVLGQKISAVYFLSLYVHTIFEL